MDFADAKRAQEQKAAAQQPTFEMATVVEVHPTHLIVRSTGVPERVVREKGIYYAVGDTVLVLRSSMMTVAVARISGQDPPAPTPLPLEGTVTSTNTGAGTFVVSTTLPTAITVKLIGTMPGVGSRARLIWQKDPDGNDVAIGGSVTTTVVPPPPVPPPPAPPPVVLPPEPPPPPGPQQTGTTYFPAAFTSGSFRNGKWRTDQPVIAQHDWGGYGVNQGAWFYDGAFRARLAGATITGCRLQMRRRPAGVGAPQTARIYRHTSDSRPAGDVARVEGPVDLLIGNGQTLWVILPVSWGQALVDSGGGFGISGSQYVVLEGLTGPNAFAESGLVALDWTR